MGAHLILVWIAVVLLHKPVFRFLEQIATAAADIPLLLGLIVIGLLSVLIWIPVWTYKMIQDLEEPTQGVGMIIFIIFFALPAWLISLFALKVFWELGFWLILSAPITGFIALPVWPFVKNRIKKIRWARWLYKRRRGAVQ